MSTPRKTLETRVHTTKCAHCAKSGLVCTGKEGIACMPCRDHHKGCEYMTHRHGSKSFFSFLVLSFANTLLVVQAHTAAVAVARVTSTSESMAVAGLLLGVQVLICHPRTTPLSSFSELSSDSGEEDESPTGWESEGSKCEREESINISVIDPLMEANADVEDLILEGQLQSLWVHMSTMHSVVLELMSEVELINLELKKRRSH
jgi:hypothetical protein